MLAVVTQRDCVSECLLAVFAAVGVDLCAKEQTINLGRL